MKNVFTDPRFPDFEVHNDGTSTFRVFELRGDGRYEEIDSFQTFTPQTRGKPDKNYRISDDVARRRAQMYYDRMAKGQISNEFAERDSDESPSGQPASDPLRSHPGQRDGGAVSLDDLMGGHVLSSDDVMDAYARAKAITDPAQREQAMEQVRQMTSRLESSAQELVRRLLD